MASNDNEYFQENVEEIKVKLNQGNNEDVCDNNDDLDDLLDSALGDFDKYSKDSVNSPSHSNNNNEKNHEGSSNSIGKPSSATDKTQETTFDKIYEEMFKQFQDASNQSGASANKTEFSNFDPSLCGDIAATLQKALGSLNQNLSDLQNENMSESDMLDLLSKMSNAGLDDSDISPTSPLNNNSNNADDIFPLMQNMMKNLLSKELLYPSLKTISLQYPSWLTSNENKISADEYKQYKEQYRLMSEIVFEYEAEQNGDSEAVKNVRMNKILDLMQQMQALGNPPKEIPKDFDYDEFGLPKIPGLLPDPNQCTVS
ncbi:hypothetical protein HELRODRAFT_166500 [Helobdella robusta]|uniref:Peroxin-19 n=1 Tax=Helobdella robusta TaxID=6412 RepID=T1EY65_HELRO|nr:hypothetical protein HELRODRAFT_166500 [Helobdella robusta]ESO11497.1 hypothetical protein HELRODRAFT_166500 [Helobdella robusta]